MSELIDDQTLLPGGDFQWLETLAFQCHRYAHRYTLRHAELIAMGCVFNDSEIESDAGSIANLRAHSPDNPGSATTSTWDRDYANGWLPKTEQPDAWSDVVSECVRRIYGSTPIEHDYDAWQVVISPASLFFHPTIAFYIGVAQRVCFLMVQHRVANCLVNAFRVDRLA